MDFNLDNWPDFIRCQYTSFFPFPGLSELPRPFQMYATSGQYRAAAELCFLTCRYLIKNIQWGAAIAQWIN